MKLLEGRVNRVALACAGIALATSAVVVWNAFDAVDGDLSGLVRMSDIEPITEYARGVDSDFHFIFRDDVYDGRYFWTIAADPFARGEPHDLIDQNAYRYGHAGYGWLAGLLSFGHRSSIPLALLAINILAMAGGAAALSIFSARVGASPWIGLAIALNPGLLFAVTVDTSEPLGVLLLVLTFLAWRAERWGYATAAILALCLTKEPYILVPIGLGIYELIKWRASGKPADLTKRVVALAAGPIVLVLWYVYLTNVFGIWPLDQTDENLVLPPLQGARDTLRFAAFASLAEGDRAQLGSAQLPLIVASLGIVIAASAKALRRISETSFPFVLLSLVVLCLSANAVFYPKDLIRNLAIVLALAPLIALRPDTGTIAFTPIKMTKNIYARARRKP